MTKTFLSKVFLTGSVLFLAAGSVLLLFGFFAPVRIMLPSAQAEERTEALMEAIAQGELDAIGSQLAGAPEFRLVDEHTNAINSILWDHYLANIDYSFSGGCYGSADGLARDVQVLVPDLPAILSQVEQRYRRLLDEPRASVAEDASDPGRYQRMVLEEALNQILSETPPRVSGTLTLNLIHQEGQWWVLPEGGLLSLLSGNGEGVEQN